MPIRYAIVVLMWLAACPVDARGESAASGPVTIKADSLSHEAEGDTYRATGSVEISWDAATLQADRAVLNRETGEAEVEGNVQLRRQGDVLRSDRLRVNLLSEQGEVINGDLFVEKPNLHVRGRKMARVGQEAYRLEDGSFTTCDGDVPSWKFAARDLDVTLEEYAVGKHAVFYIKNVPVFYTPYVLFPVKRERQSGFLFPRIGSSTKKGFYLDIPYYWAVSPSQDVTFDLDLQTRRGVGAGADYRYIRREGSDGQIRGYGLYDTSERRFRGDMEGRARDRVAAGVDAKADVAFVTDREFYRDFAVTSGAYNRQLLDSSVSVARNGDDSSLTAQVRYVQDLYSPDDRLTLQRLPVVSYSLLGQRFGSAPAFVSLDSSFTSFYREEGQTGQRLQVHPNLKIVAPFAGVGVSLWGGYRQRFYGATRDDVGGGYRGIGNADAGAALTTSLARVYDVGWGSVQKIRHTVIPEIGYRFVETRNQESLPFFDFDDRVPGESTAVWSVSNFFTGRVRGEEGAVEYRDLLWLRLSQGYRLHGTRRDLLTLADPGHPFSDLRFQLRSNPAKHLLLSADTRFDLYGGNFSTASLFADLDDRRGNSLGFGYHMARGVVEYLEGRVGLSLVKPFVFNYTGRYSFDRGSFLEGLYALEYKQQCWSLTFSFRDRPDNREFLVSFSLAGIGGLGPLRTF